MKPGDRVRIILANPRTIGSEFVGQTGTIVSQEEAAEYWMNARRFQVDYMEGRVWIRWDRPVSKFYDSDFLVQIQRFSEDDVEVLPSYELSQAI